MPFRRKLRSFLLHQTFDSVDEHVLRLMKFINKHIHALLCRNLPAVCHILTFSSYIVEENYS
jgi:hypothetical protein